VQHKSGGYRSMQHKGNLSYTKVTQEWLVYINAT